MDLRERLHRFIHHPVVDASIMMMILLSVSLLISELTLEPGPTLHLITIINEVLTGIFIVELCIRYYVARNKRRFFALYWIDIIAVIPWVRSLRLLRLLRLLRIFRMGLLLTRRLRNMSKVFQGAAGETLILLMIIVIIVLASAIGIRLLEGHGSDFHNFESGLWWAVMTLIAGEPIGGEATTRAGKALTLGVMMGGLTLFAVFTGVVSAVMVDRLRGLNIRAMEIEELRQHTIICGWNRSGRTILRELAKDTRQIRHGLVIIAEFDIDPDLGEHGIDPELLFVVRDDFTQLEVLKHCGVPFASRALLLADQTRERSNQDIDARTVLAAIAVERMNPEIYTSVELLNRDNGAHLKIMGVEEIVVGDEYAGSLIAMGMRNRGLSGIVNELVTAKEGNEFIKLPLPASLAGRRLAELRAMLLNEHSALLIAVEQAEADASAPSNLNEQWVGRMRINPPDDLRLREGDMLVVIAEKRPRLNA